MFRRLVFICLISLLIGLGMSLTRLQSLQPKVIPSFLPVTPSVITPSISPQYLPQDIIYHAASSSAQIALTFDADMTPGMAARMATDSAITWYNDKLIGELRETQTPVTLFLTGMWIENHLKISQELARDPLFELANHSYSHPAFAQPCFGLKVVSDDHKPEQILKTQVLLKKLTGQENRYFRFPGGCFNKNDLKLVKSLGLIAIQWNSQGPDSFNTNTKGIIQNLKRLTKPGAIIVLHMHGEKNAPNTAAVVKDYIPWARSKGYTFVKLTDLLQ